MPPFARRLPFVSAAAAVLILASPASGAPVWRLPEAASQAPSLWIALDATPDAGASVVEPARIAGEAERGRRVFLGFQADALVRVEGGEARAWWRYEDYRWRAGEGPPPVAAEAGGEGARLAVRPRDGAPAPRAAQWFAAGATASAAGGAERDYARTHGDALYLPRVWRPAGDGAWSASGPFERVGGRPRIYQMLPRLFGNENDTRKVNGTLAENGSGKFSDLSADVLEGLREHGFSHLWLTGVLQQATATDYGGIGQPADDPDLLKGIAGSPYAIKDYFDVSPDYAEDPARRMEAFRAAARRAREAGLKVVIDFVPNHVARSYASDVRPDQDFGEGDRTERFFHPGNNFYYLSPELTPEGDGPPLRLPTVDPETGDAVSPTARVVGGADGRYPPEEGRARVTGNNVVRYRPSLGDWYETVKLNYGQRFLEPREKPAYPSAVTPDAEVPDTWRKMDAVIAFWQERGVDGFRADMAHMVPPEFWKWLIARARERDGDVFFFAEAYDADPAKVAPRAPWFRPGDPIQLALLDAGFDAVYDDAGYDALHELYEGQADAQDFEAAQAALGPYVRDRAVRYAENHDEVRLAHPDTWGGHGGEVGRPVTGALFALSRGPVMVYHGQQVAEPALRAEGFGGDDARTTIFDYWSMPEFNRWWNGGAADGGELDAEQSALRAFYGRLLRLAGEPAFASGEAHPLNAANRANPFYGKAEDRGDGGRWFFAALRHDPETGDRYLVAVNFHPKATLRHIRVRVPAEAREAAGLASGGAPWLTLRERLAADPPAPLAQPADHARREGIYLPEMPPMTARYWELAPAEKPPADAEKTPALAVGEAHLGLPPLQRLQAGESLAIDLRRFGDPGETHRFEVGDHPGLELELDRLNHRLRATARDGASGLASVPLRLAPKAGRTGEATEVPLLFAVRAVPAVELAFPAREGVERVSAVGDFNQWQAGATPLERREDGRFAAELRLAPGRYLYKFVVDGEWRPDPANPDRTPDGYGGKNSVLTVEGEAGGPRAELFLVREDEGELIFRAVGGSGADLAEARATAPADAGGARDLPVEIRGRWARVSTHGLDRGATVRLAAETTEGRVPGTAVANVGGLPDDSWRDEIIYYAFTDRFLDGEPANTERVDHPEVAEPANYHGGDFQGIRKKLESGYFDRLGVSVLWLAPLNRNPEGAWQEYLPPYRHYTGYHGYWPVDRREVEPRFGGTSALRELIETAHGDGVRVLADLVLKHVHSEHPWWPERRSLFGRLELPDGTRNLRQWEANPFTTWFEPFLPAFDFRNPESIELLLEDAVHWMDEYGLDGYRLDAVKHIRPDFWWRFRSRLRAAFPEQNPYFVGETFQSRRGIAAFVGPNMLDGQFDFPLYDTLIPVFAHESQGFGALESALAQSEQVYGKLTLMSPLLGNHDKPRFMAYADGDLPHPTIDDAEEAGWKDPPDVDNAVAYERLEMAMAFLLTIDGVPMIYYGDEIGLTGAGDPDNRRPMRFGGETTARERAVREHFARLAHARREHPALYMGSRRPLVAEGEHYAYVRAHRGDRAVVLFNRSESAHTFRLDVSPEIGSATLRDVVGERSVRARGGRLTVTVPSREAAVLVTEAAE